MNAEPLPKRLFDKAKGLGVTEIHLEFSGGSDQGYLSVGCEGSSNCHDLEQEIEEWAWDAYDYSGAGDGSDYGDDITYDLVEMTISTSEWCMVRQDGDREEMTLAVGDEEEVPGDSV